MDCRQAQALWSLVIGQDQPDSAELAALERHTRGCPGCRRFHDDLSRSQTALQEARLTIDPRPRLWPRVSATLIEWERRPKYAVFNVWVPTAIASLACLLLVSVAVWEVDRHRDGSSMIDVVLQRPAPRNLFVSDPAFRGTLGAQPTQDDLRRWQGKHAEAFPGGLPGVAPVPASNRNVPPPHPRLSPW
jgi:hypothetical protein